MSVYKLYYFNVRGRGEICRLAFTAANIEYEDIRLDSEDWVKEKECKWKNSRDLWFDGLLYIYICVIVIIATVYLKNFR